MIATILALAMANTALVACILWAIISARRATLARVARADHDIRESIASDLRLSAGLRAVGLVAVEPDSLSFDYGPILENDQRIVILLNDGRTWLSTQRSRLAKRLGDPDKETTVFLIRPESSMVDVLARKGNITPEVLSQRIRESVALLEELRGSRTNLEILGHELFNPHAVVLGDASAVVTPYFASRGGRTVPAMVYADVGAKSYFRFIRDDLEALRKDAADITQATSGRGPAPSRTEDAN